jgi:hypothetical protein
MVAERHDSRVAQGKPAQERDAKAARLWLGVDMGESTAQPLQVLPVLGGDLDQHQEVGVAFVGPLAERLGLPIA